MVCYGAMSGKAPAWPWQAWVFREQQVAGFNLRSWLSKNTRKVRASYGSFSIRDDSSVANA